MTTTEIKKVLESTIDKINKTELINFIKSWINNYIGKTIGFRVENEHFYITFGSEGAKIHDGEPASFDLLLISSSEVALKLVKEPSWRLFRDLLSSGDMQIWGNMHEARSFFQILQRPLRVQGT